MSGFAAPSRRAAEDLAPFRLLEDGIGEAAAPISKDVHTILETGGQPDDNERLRLPGRLPDRPGSHRQ